MTTTNLSTVALQNDDYRAHLLGRLGVPGRTMLTRGVAALDVDTQAAVLLAVSTFDRFTPDNDPHHEHDCALLTVEGLRVLWKFDYYADNKCEAGAENPCSCFRVLTIMLAEEY